MNKKRKLAAILFADIVGYTALMQKDEKSARQNLEKFRNTLDEKVEKHHGQIIQYYGDGCLCTFDSTVDGVQCAKEVQQIFQSEPKVPVRIGLHSGDVFFEAGNVYGDAVNIASRVESIGVPGSVLVSSSVQNQIKNQTNFKLQSLGKFAFKNVEREMTVYALSNEGFPVPDKASINGKLKVPQQKKWTWLLTTLIAIMGLIGGFFWWKSPTATPQVLSANIIADKSIAVLAFRDLSPKGDQGYFGDGIAEEILNALDQLEDLRVIGRTSSFSFKGKDVPIPEIGQQLNVSTILEGSVRKFNNRVRINVKLVDAKADQQIWSQSFDRELVDIFAIQNEIAVSVANNLKLNLLDNQAEQLAHSSTTNPAAYELFLRAKALMAEYSDSRQAPIDLLMQAIKLDPNFVDAYAELVFAKGWLAWSGEVEPKIAFSQALQALAFGKNINPNSKDIRLTEFVINLWYNWDWEKMERAITQQDANVHALANYYTFIGHHEKAIENTEINIKNNPLNLVVRSDGIKQLYYAERWEEAIDLAWQTKELFPESLITYTNLSDVYYFKGEYQKALEILELAKAKTGNKTKEDIFYKTELIQSLSKLGRIQEAEVLLKELHEKEKNRYVDPIHFVWAYVSLGEKEKALDYLEKAYQFKSTNMIHIKTSPFFDELRNEPRFQTILKKLNFPEVVKE